MVSSYKYQGMTITSETSPEFSLYVMSKILGEAIIHLKKMHECHLTVYFVTSNKVTVVLKELPNTHPAKANLQHG